MAKCDLSVPAESTIDMPRSPPYRPQPISPQLAKPDIKALCIFHDHSVVTIAGKGFRGKSVSEYSLSLRDGLTVASSKQLCELPSGFKRGLQIRVFKYEALRVIFMFICDLDGEIEIVKIRTADETHRQP